MKLKLQLNIGTDDARKLGLTHTQAGDTVDVPDDVANTLIKNQWAVAENAADVSKSADVRTVPSGPDMKAVPNPQTFNQNPQQNPRGPRS